MSRRIATWCMCGLPSNLGGTSRHPWYDCAIVRFDASDDPEEEKWQLGYVQIGIIFEAAGENYMLVRWMTSAQLGGAIENSQNEFESR